MPNEIAVRNENLFNIPDGFICTVDLNDVKGKVIAANALNAATALSNHVGEVFNLVDIITAPGTRAQSGAPCENVYLILDDGRAYFSQSEGVAKSARFITGLWNGDFGTGIKIRCDEQKLDSGRTLKTLNIVFE